MRSSDRRKVNVLEMNCLISLVGAPRMDRVWNEGVRRSGSEISSIDGFIMWRE